MEQNGQQEFVITSPEMMGEVADVLLAKILANPTRSIVGLSGELGAGKTTFMRAFLAKVGVTNKASSPTFVVRKAYPVGEGTMLSGKFETVSHVDAYRLERPEDALVTGIVADADQHKTLLFVEWPERLGESLSKHDSYLGTLQFEHVDTDVRKVVLVSK